MSQLGSSILTEKKNQNDWRDRVKENALLRNRLEVEINEPLMRKMFRSNQRYLEDVRSGKVYSSRHNAYHQSVRSRHALFYTMITDPFTDQQLDWILEEFGQVWMKNKKEQMENNEYIWKVLLSECFIKLYMDHFGFSKKEAEQRISETPLHKNSDSSDDEL